MIIWVIAGLLGLATGLRIGWALVNKQSLVSAAMIVALGSLGLVAALNWEPLTLLLDTILHWPNVSSMLSQVALIACAAGSCVMITSASSSRKPLAIRRIALAQYSVAAAIAALTLVLFFLTPRQPEMAPQEYLRRNLGSGGNSLSWLLPLLYVLLALTLVAWAGVRNSNRTRRGRALFVFSVGIVLIVLASAFILLRAAGSTQLVGVGAAATILGCAMLVVASGSLLPSVEDWFGARRELRTIAPLLAELSRRHPNIGIGVRPRGPLLFRVAEQMSLISDALYLEATAVLDGGATGDGQHVDVAPDVQARRVASWIYDGRSGRPKSGSRTKFPGPSWLRQPATYSDREWILAIAAQYRELDRQGKAEATGTAAKASVGRVKAVRPAD
ncbi:MULTISPECIES: hypothetical protein [Mycolicibacterium]|uniref:hypothetical protein n=1 Tax=Mycolicibacterium TaxID=1866885 RepID=UPI0009294543|nr:MULTISPECIES: hypothetical protein [Mycolicibacterium]RUP27049.1 MAG: hypothetical protein EKK51_28305 [Mycolicibacterium sp.]UCZ60445.1 hypothetical protein LHJ73_28075 [Mycolicibacterium phocaicum]SHU88187.1 Uncharacterised protein [Mycobacteroides abscessus subsp. abscessus]